MIFNTALYLSLSICTLGLIYRVWRWFGMSIGPDVAGESAVQRMRNAGKAVLRFLCSWKILLLFKNLFLDVLLQAGLYKTHKIRWFFHVMLFYAFILLVCMHAMDDVITKPLFSEYESTLNPYMFLRNLFGVIAFSGILFVILRRIRKKPFPAATNRSDRLAIVILILILLSGFLLEAIQIFSAPVFDEMVMDYMGTDDPEEVAPLQSYWAKEYGVVFPEAVDLRRPELLAQGRVLHEENCAVCHVRPTSAFASYPLSVSLRSFARDLNAFRADIWLWYVHFMSCFIGLAYLPFSKFFHIISVPLHWMIRTGESQDTVYDPNRAVKRAIGVDACTHCGICSLHCSVMPVYRVTKNSNVLPSEKLLSLSINASGKDFDRNKYVAFSHGSFACTDCRRCTNLCPSGIDLHELWQASKKELVCRAYPPPDQWIRERSASQWESLSRQSGLPDTPETDEYLLRNLPPESFAGCVQCTICANVCPVVSVPDSLSAPEVTPQQVMNLLRLDLKELAMGSRMVWDCMTCYMCQEHCPQGIKVTDILYELRNMGASRLSKVRFRESVKPKKAAGADEPAEGDGE